MGDRDGGNFQLDLVQKERLSGSEVGRDADRFADGVIVDGLGFEAGVGFAIVRAENDQAVGVADAQTPFAPQNVDIHIGQEHALEFQFSEIMGKTACLPNQVANFGDIFNAVQAFQGISYEDLGCAIACP